MRLACRGRVDCRLFRVNFLEGKVRKLGCDFIGFGEDRHFVDGDQFASAAELDLAVIVGQNAVDGDDVVELDGVDPVADHGVALDRFVFKSCDLDDDRDGRAFFTVCRRDLADLSFEGISGVQFFAGSKRVALFDDFAGADRLVGEQDLRLGVFIGQNALQDKFAAPLGRVDQNGDVLVVLIADRNEFLALFDRPRDRHVIFCGIFRGDREREIRRLFFSVFGGTVERVDLFLRAVDDFLIGQLVVNDSLRLCLLLGLLFFLIVAAACRKERQQHQQDQCQG